MAKLVRNKVNQALKAHGGKKHSSIIRSLPYTIPMLKAHLESFFDNANGFTWENHGTVWHIDHIIPHSLFRYTTTDCKTFRDCWALSNLRPLAAVENLRKGAKLV